MMDKRFGRLIVVAPTSQKSKSGHSFWCCRCDCGTELIVDAQNLKNGHTRSCGCLRRDTIKKVNFKHGKTRSPEFTVWSQMRQRCKNKRSKSFKNYGGRGIKIDPRWNTFSQFIADMGLRPDLTFTLDRKDNNGPYSPENCRWASRDIQANNTRKNHMITFNGTTKSLAQWARDLGIKPSTLRMRLSSYKWTTLQALSN